MSSHQHDYEIKQDIESDGRDITVKNYKRRPNQTTRQKLQLFLSKIIKLALKLPMK